MNNQELQQIIEALQEIEHYHLFKEFEPNEFNSLLLKHKKELEDLESQILFNKGQEYHVNKDVLSNFRKNAELVGVSPLVIAGIFLSKHYQSIMNYIKKDSKGEASKDTESIVGRINDARNYLLFIFSLLQIQGKDL